jgi:hypothetical protein
MYSFQIFLISGFEGSTDKEEQLESKERGVYQHDARCKGGSEIPSRRRKGIKGERDRDTERGREIERRDIRIRIRRERKRGERERGRERGGGIERD